jgi:hypothetical protein
MAKLEARHLNINMSSPSYQPNYPASEEDNTSTGGSGGSDPEPQPVDPGTTQKFVVVCLLTLLGYGKNSEW